MQLLREFSTLSYDADSIKKNREKNGGKIVLSGILQRADTLNQNGRVYPRAILEREVRNYQKFIRERRAVAELDHPESSVINLKNVSHVVTEATIDEEGIVRGKLELLDTPQGKTAQSLVESGIILGISSRGVGSTKHEGGNDYVQEDFILIGFDLVSEPSTPNAFMLPENKNISRTDLRKILSRSDRIDRAINEILGWK